MKKLLFLLVLCSIASAALRDLSIPNSFSPFDTIRSSEHNANNDTIAVVINQNNDSLDANFVRFTDLADTTFDTLKAAYIRADDSLRSTKLFVSDSAFIDTLNNNIAVINDSAYIDTLTSAKTTITTADINGGNIDGTAIGAASPSTGVFTTITANTSLSTGLLTVDTVQASSSSGLYVLEDGGAGLFVENGGEVGIGTFTPQDALEIATTNPAMRLTKLSNSSFVEFDGTNQQIATNRSPITGIFADTTKSHAQIGLAGMTTSSNITFSTAAAPNTTASVRMKVDSAGNVGIGTTSPANLLDVNGGIDATTLNTGQGDYELYAMDQDVETTNAVTFATVNTGQGANELYAMNQDVETTDAVTFATVNTGQGANELYDMDQNVKTNSDVRFDSLYTTAGALLTDGTEAILDLDLTASYSNGIGPILSFYANDPVTRNDVARIQGVVTANTDEGRLIFGTRNTGMKTRMLIDENGNVGINTSTTPATETLEVNGTFLVDSITTNSSDYFSYEENVVEITYLGFSGTVNDSIRYTKIGNVVHLTFDTFTGTSNSTSFLTGSSELPADITPATAQQFGTFRFTDGGTTNTPGSVEVDATGAITFEKHDTSGGLTTWTNSSTKGIHSSFTITYRLE